MKRMLQGLVLCTALVAVTAQAAAPYFAFRSQSVNAVRELVGEQTLINRYDADTFYAVFSLTPEFTRTFKAGQLAQCLFGPQASCNDCGATINVIGSLIPTVADDGGTTTNTARGNAWLADYFGLARDYNGSLSFAPRIWNFNLDFNLYVGLDEWAQGLYFRIHAPLTYSKWNLNFCENKGNAPGTLGYEQGYFSPEAVTVPNLYQTAGAFFTGGTPVPNLGLAPDDFPIIFEPLQFSKFNTCCDGNGICRLSDIEMAFGWNFHLDCDSHLGAEIRWSVPTGNKPRADYMFMPVIGNGGEWKLGAGLSGHRIFWRSDCSDTSLGIWFDANIQHIFSTCQDRVFDLRCKPNSRYMLAEKMVKNTQPLDGGPDTGHLTPSNYMFADHFAPIANLTHQNVYVNVPVEGDVVVKLTYMHCNFEFDLGYEFWGRSCEQICQKQNRCGNRIENETWALKGDAFVYGFNDRGADPYTVLALGASEHNASICSGTNFVAGVTDPSTNPNIDFAQLAFSVEDPVTSIPTTEGEPQTHTSIQTVILKNSDVGYEDAQTKSYSNKVFAHLGYTWPATDCNITKFLGIGGSAEFAPSCGDKDSCKDCKSNDNCCDSDNNCCSTSCDTSSCSNNSCTDCNAQCGGCSNSGCCQQCGLNQWAVWLKGGIAW